MIDWKKLIPADEVKARESRARISVRKGQCRDAILMVWPETTQRNLAAAASVGRLDPDQLAAYRLGLDWIDLMRKAASTPDAEFPVPPSRVTDLAKVW